MKVLVVFACVLATVAALPFGGPEGRITNGTNASPGQFPYQVGLELGKNRLLSAWCGGSLLNNEWILTAAHCTERKSQVTVFLGATERKQPELKYTVGAEHIIVHPGWNRTTVLNDISLIKIPFTNFTSRIKPVKLPALASSYSSYVGDVAVASGWGKISDEKEKASVQTLQYGEMGVISNLGCKKYYGRFIQKSHLCVATNNASSTCSGDSGGPLVSSSSGVQIGLTSFGPSDGCTLGMPVVFTRLTTYLEWIHKYIGASSY